MPIARKRYLCTSQIHSMLNEITLNFDKQSKKGNHIECFIKNIKLSIYLQLKDLGKYF